MKLALLAFVGPALVAAQPSTTAAPTYCELSPNSYGCTPTGYCINGTQGTQLANSTCDTIGEPIPCYAWDLLVTIGCDDVGGQPCTWIGDGYCDDATYYTTDFNCAANDYDGGDCDTIYDCDGTMQLLNLVGDGSCDNGRNTLANFDCEAFDYDGYDCPATDCDQNCIDTYGADDVNNTCQEDFNCKKFEYSWGACAPSNICPDDWYDMGRDNYRCSTKTGGTRFAATQMAEFDECVCYTWCQAKAGEAGVTLTAFDDYSDKCRCWEGECSDESLIQCKGAEGKNAPDFSDNDGRCPSAVYFPYAQTDDCHASGWTQDVTMYYNYFYDNYYDDGYCDNAEFGMTDWSEYDYGTDPIGDYDCDDFKNDGEDCLAATCDEIWEITQFAALDDANMVCDGHDNEIYKETPWTTACDCFELCASDSSDTTVMFQRNANDQCQCLTHCESQTNCGLESGCQIFTTERTFDCCDNEWTMGYALTDLINEEEMGDFLTSYVNSQQEAPSGDKVVSIEFLEALAVDQQYCVPAFMCTDHSYSWGEVDSSGDIVSSPCFACLATSQTVLDAYTINNTRCDASSNDGIRFMQLTDYYSVASGRSPFVLDDYCICEVTCRLAKFEFYQTGSCPAIAGMAGYNAWADSESTAFAVDSYKGDCRCWDYCTANTTWVCTGGVNDRCVEEVAVLLWSDPGTTIVLPDHRPYGGVSR